MTVKIIPKVQKTAKSSFLKLNWNDVKQIAITWAALLIWFVIASQTDILPVLQQYMNPQYAVLFISFISYVGKKLFQS